MGTYMGIFYADLILKRFLEFFSIGFLFREFIENSLIFFSVL